MISGSLYLRCIPHGEPLIANGLPTLYCGMVGKQKASQAKAET
jgi:hypothetical protein